jgi:hypothetical protein
MLKADIGEDKLAGKIKIFLAVKVPEVRTFTGRNWKRRDLCLRGPRMKDMCSIEIEDFFTARRVGEEL